MGELEDVKESLSKLWDRVWMGADNHHARIGNLENKFLDFINFKFPKMSETLEDIRKSFREFQIRLLGNGEKGLIDKKIDERLVGFEKQMNDMIIHAIADAFSSEKEKIEKIKERWGIRSWAVFMLALALLAERLWDRFLP